MGSRVRVSPSMVVATIALIVAMAGTGVAAVLITSSQIKDNTIQSQDVRDGTLRSVDYRDGSVTPNDLSSQVRASLGHELVYTEGTLTNIPATFTNQFPASGDRALSSTTTRSGRLWITVHVNYDIVCPSGAGWFYLMIDGVPIRSSVVRLALDNTASGGGTVSDRTLSGVTEKRFNPGTYTIAPGAQCTAGTATGSATGSDARNQTIVVIR